MNKYKKTLAQITCLLKKTEIQKKKKTFLVCILKKLDIKNYVY